MKPKLSSVMLAASMLVVGACAQAQTVKIGFLGTLSGPAGALGQDQYDAFMLGVEHLGGKFGGATVQVVKEDDQLKPDLGVQLAQKLIEKDKVNLITGVTFSNVMMAVHKPITSAGLILVGSNAGPTPITGKGCSPLYFSTSWNNDSLHESMGQYAQDTGYKKVYLMAPNYQAGKDAISGFKRYFKGQVLDEVYTQVNQPDYSAEIAQLQAAKPDAIYVFYPGGMGVNFVKQYQQAGLLGKLPMLSTSTVDGTTLPALKDIALGAITGSPYSADIDNPQNKKFVADFQKKYNRVPSLYAAQSYDAAMLINSALTKTAGKTDNTEALRTALKAADFKSVAGPFKFNTNQFPIRHFYRVDVAKDASGAVALVNKGVALKDHADAYYKECAIK
ncbi:MAG: ABC transporter substrate-binding protein [Betaproteobacteria bacterium]|jgi:branched-chain amino acid transport system substrate-binding protein|nr:ABC transporter substrate-binding protein [Betaproteobacteria bacterium]MBK7656011.1 ABC transporter substrate-binding protein [Betaproteobacteria bacterium]MBP6646119.1 ABC transporter substrate-binding protein [Burkholderiaceae bacterium]